MLSTTSLKTLGPEDLLQARRILDTDPVTHCFVASRVHASGMQTWRMGGDLWGWYRDTDLVSLCYAGANLVPVAGTPESLFAFADRARRIGRRCSSIVGPADEVGELWRHLQHAWGPARDVRMRQPVLVRDTDPDVAVDPEVRVVREHELDALLPASIAMFTEEVGVPPTHGDSLDAYRARVVELVRAGRCYARFEDGRVVFKAEVGAATDQVCQIQGVWVAPDRRGRGLAVPGVAAVVALARRRVAPTVSLYVNDYNAAALATYARAGFVPAGTFASILF